MKLLVLTLLLSCANVAFGQDQSPRIEWIIEESEMHRSFSYLFKERRGVIIGEAEQLDLLPLLPMLFYEAGESDLPKRYVFFSDAAQTVGFMEDTIKNTLNAYYNYLNILGSRMQKYPSSKIEIVGCISQDTSVERDIKLSRSRAEIVAGYLVAIWKIDPARITITPRGLPKYPSDPKLPGASQENRRVEIETDTWELVKPALTIRVIHEVYPSKARFKIISQPGTYPERLVIAVNNTTVWRTFNRKEIEQLQGGAEWDWKNAEGRVVPTGSTITAQLFFEDGLSTKKDTVVTRWMNLAHAIRVDSTREVYNILLFPTGRIAMSKWAKRILKEYILPRLDLRDQTDPDNPYRSTIAINGFGGEASISKNRIMGVIAEIKKDARHKLPDIQINTYSDAASLYPLEYPEGRCYNRLVQIITEMKPKQ